MGKTNDRLSKKCRKCNQVRFKDLPRNRYFILSSNESVRIANLLNPNVVIEINDLICNNCYNKAFNIESKQNSSSISIHASSNEAKTCLMDINTSQNINDQVFEETECQNQDNLFLNEKAENKINETLEYSAEKLQSQENDFIFVDLPKSYSSHKNCVVCRKNCGKLHIIQSEARTQVLLSRNIFIPVGCRTCRVHLNESGLFKAIHLDLLEIEEIETKINRKTANDLIQTLIDTSKKRTLFDEFADPFKIDEEVCKLTTGFYKDEFNVICSYLDEMKDSQIRTKSQALAIYLFWLKTGMSQNAIKAHFRLNDRIEVSRYCEQVRSSLSSNFVPEFLGTEVMNRQEWLQQNTPLAKELYSLKDDELVVIADGKNF